MALWLLLDELSDEVLSSACYELRDAADQLCVLVDRRANARMAALEPEIDMTHDSLIETIIDFIVC